MIILRSANISDEELISDLKRVSFKLQKNCFSNLKYQRHGKYSMTTFLRRFGSWNSAMQAAGLVSMRPPRISIKELLDNLEQVWRHLGRQPCNYEMNRPPSKYGGTTYLNRFGSWRAALSRYAFEKDISPTSLNSARGRFNRKATSSAMRLSILKRDRYRCVLCGAIPSLDPSVELHIDHIIPVSKGGKTIPENLQTLCARCNLGKSDKVV